MDIRKYIIGGVAKHDSDGQWHVHATNREVYGNVLSEDGKSDILLFHLTKPMTKEEICEYLLSVRQCARDKQIVKALQEHINNTIALNAQKQINPARATRKPRSDTGVKRGSYKIRSSIAHVEILTPNVVTKAANKNQKSTVAA